MARLVSLSILIGLIIFLGITFFQVVAPFLLPLFLAAVVTVIFRPLFHYFLTRTKQRVRIAAGLTTATIMTMLLLPLLVGIAIGSLQLFVLAQSWEIPEAKTRVHEVIEQGRESLFGYVQPLLPQYDQIEDSQERIDAQKRYFDAQLAPIQQNLKSQLNLVATRSLGIARDKTFDLLGAVLSLLIGTIMFMIALYYFLADGPALLRAAEGLIPVHAKYQRQLLQQFDKVIRAVVLATFLAALGQGLATAILLTVAGFTHFFIVFVVGTFASLIPLAGTWLVWGPCAILLASDGHWGSAIFLTLFGSIGIGTLDNVIKTYVLQSDAKLHPLLAFVSVLGGLQVLGLWGVFVGPIVACCLHALIQIFNTELKEFSKERNLDLIGQRQLTTRSAKQADRGSTEATDRPQVNAQDQQAEQQKPPPKSDKESATDDEQGESTVSKDTVNPASNRDDDS